MSASIERFISPARRRHDLVVIDRDRPLPVGERSFREALLHDAYRLPHLFHADQLAVVTVAVLADRNIEFQLGIAFVRLRAAQIPRRAGARTITPENPQAQASASLTTRDIDVALLEDAVAGQQRFEVVADLQERVTESPDVVDQFGGQILCTPPGRK